MSEAIEKTTVQSNQQIWKMELDELRKQKTNKSLPTPVQKLIDEQIAKLEERVGRYDEYRGLLTKTKDKIELLNRKLSDLKRSQHEFEVFLGVSTSDVKTKATFNVDEVVSFIKKHGGSVMYGELSNFTGISRVKLKSLITKHPNFKIDTTVFPHRVTVK